jgi:uncharacterized protein
MPMRRKEHTETNLVEIERFLAQMSFGFLATQSEMAYPAIVPLNFVWAMGAIYFHSSRLGQKVKDLKLNNNVTFCVADETALIPSYFTSEKLACPATAFFKSVMIYGKAQFVEDIDEKVEALSAFMKKLQPEGGYAPFDITDEEYRREIKSVLVTRITPDSISAKFKFGQNRNEKEWTHVRDGLVSRNKIKDAEAVAAMEKRCPFHLPPSL